MKEIGRPPRVQGIQHAYSPERGNSFSWLPLILIFLTLWKRVRDLAQQQITWFACAKFPGWNSSTGEDWLKIVEQKNLLHISYLTSRKLHRTGSKNSRICFGRGITSYQLWVNHFILLTFYLRELIRRWVIEQQSKHISSKDEVSEPKVN